MGNAIQTMSAAQIEAAFNRDLYIVTRAHEGSGYFIETMFSDASLAALVEDLWKGDINPREVLSITMLNRGKKISRRADHEVCRVLSARSERLCQTPYPLLREWMEEFGAHYFKDAEYLRSRAANDLLSHADYQRDIRVAAE